LEAKAAFAPIFLSFSPFCWTFGVGALSGAEASTSLQPEEQTSAKVSQWRRRRRQGARKTGRKPVEKGLLKSQRCGKMGEKRENVRTSECWKDYFRHITQVVDEVEAIPCEFKRFEDLATYAFARARSRALLMRFL
jgi:hypothetical protein